MKEKRNCCIQLLRIFACGMVFLVHFGQRTGFSGLLRQISDFGAYGVHLFFLISGFLAGKTFFDNCNVDIKTYYKKRAITVLPLYYLVILFCFIIENLINTVSPCIPEDELGVGWFRYLFLLNGFLNSDTYFWSNLGMTWTIPIFMFFYLIAPWLLRKAKSVLSCFIIWMLVFFATQISNIFYPCKIFDNLHLLFLGVVLYACVNKNSSSKAIVLFCLSATGTTILGVASYAYISIFCIIILSICCVDKIVLPAPLQKTVDLVDSYSYTLYLMQGIIFCSLIDRLNNINVSTVVIAIVAVFGTLVSTCLVGRFVEKPLQKQLRKLLIK